MSYLTLSSCTIASSTSADGHGSPSRLTWARTWAWLSGALRRLTSGSLSFTLAGAGPELALDLAEGFTACGGMGDAARGQQGGVRCLFKGKPPTPESFSAHANFSKTMFETADSRDESSFNKARRMSVCAESVLPA